VFPKRKVRSIPLIPHGKLASFPALVLSTHEVAAIQGKPLKYIILYCVQILYYLTFVVGLRSWWLVAFTVGIVGVSGPEYAWNII
jgi:hypothetical protein